jgi:hypothetical protein
MTVWDNYPFKMKIVFEDNTVACSTAAMQLSREGTFVS